MSLNLPNAQTAKELGISQGESRAMSGLLREGACGKRPGQVLEGEVEFDEPYVIAGHKGHPEAVKEKGAGRGDAF